MKHPNRGIVRSLDRAIDILGAIRDRLVADAQTSSGAVAVLVKKPRTRPEASSTCRFHTMCVVVAPGQSVTATALYEAYRQWCKRRAIEPLTLPNFERVFTDLGVTKERINGKTRYLDISIVGVTGPDDDGLVKTPTYQADAA